MKFQDQIAILKTAIIEGCKNALAAFKERGAAALNGIARFFRVRPSLEKMQVSLEKAEQRNARAVAKIEAISAEYHKAGRH